MKAKFIKENLENILKPKEEAEIQDKWVKKFGVSFKDVKSTMNHLQHLGVDIEELSTMTGRYRVNGFQIFYTNHGLLRVLKKEDAEEIIEVLKNNSYEQGEFTYKPEIIMVDYSEARRYIIKKSYKIKEYPEKGKTRIY